MVDQKTHRQENQPQAPEAALARYVPRPRLHAELDSITAGPVAVVRAPAGWGKSSLLSDWTRSRHGACVWLTVRDGDDPHFWQRLRDELRRTTGVPHDDPHRHDGGKPALNGGKPHDRGGNLHGAGADREAGTAAEPDGWVAALPVVADPPVVVVDEADRITDPGALRTMAEAVPRLRGRLRLVLAYRSEPRLPLHRWRVAGLLGQLDTERLAFTASEVDQLLDAYGIALGRAATADLNAITQGWPAGLRMAALAMIDRADPENALAGLGTHDLTAEYVTDEVLAPLPACLRQVLVQMSTVDGFTAGLAQSLTGRDDGPHLLEQLDPVGPMLERPDTPGGWYHVHPLLNRVLYTQLRGLSAARLYDSHRRAGRWYLRHGPAVDAVRHLLAAGAWDEAAEVVAHRWTAVLAGGPRGAIRELTIVPPDDLAARPMLALALAAERLDAGDAVAVRGYLRLATPADPEREARVPAPLLAAFRLAAARLDGDTQRVLDVAARLPCAIAGAPPDRRPTGVSTPAGRRTTPAVRAARNRVRDDQTPPSRDLYGTMATGWARLMCGQWEQAGADLEAAVASASVAGTGEVEISAGSHLAGWLFWHGRLHAAVHTAQDSMVLADRLGLTTLADLAWARVALCNAYLQWDRLVDAQRVLDGAFGHVRDAHLSAATAIAQARLWGAYGEYDAADGLLQAARQDLAGSVSPTGGRALAVLAAELRARCGDLAEARHLLDTDHPREPLERWVTTVEASILLAEGKAADAVRTAAPLRTPQAALIGALAQQALGNQTGAVRCLEVALQAAETEGYRRPFTGGGHAVQDLIAQVAPALSHHRAVLADLTATMDPVHGTIAGNGTDITAAHGPATPTPAALVEALTEREMTVLRYLQGTLSNMDIAGLLFISVNTLKTHLKNLYRKLDVTGRRDAVARGRRLGLI